VAILCFAPAREQAPYRVSGRSRRSDGRARKGQVPLARPCWLPPCNGPTSPHHKKENIRIAQSPCSVCAVAGHGFASVGIERAHVLASLVIHLNFAVLRVSLTNTPLPPLPTLS